MPLIDPFSTLAVPKDLVVAFIGCFSRCEYAMKASTYARDDHGIAAAAWQRLANDAVGWVQVEAGSPLEQAIELLVTEPPRVQSFAGGWQAVPLRGAQRLAQAIDAAVRVRHNLFHGGKHSPEAAPGRDEALVRAALTLLTAVVDQCPGDLRGAFNNG